MKDEKFHIDFILDCIRKIEKYTQGLDKDSFRVNELQQSGAILQLMLIGETSKKLSDETKSKINLPWKQIAGFRDVAIHDYVDLNLDTIWDAVQHRIPELKEKLENFK